MLTQNKKRLFDHKKSEYTFRSLNYIIFSINCAKKKFPEIIFDIIVVDHNSKINDLNQIKKQLNKSQIKNSIVSLNINEFTENISKQVVSKMEKVLDDLSINYHSYISQINNQGIEVL